MCVYLYVYISRCLYLYALDICTYYIADVYMKTTSCIPLSLSLPLKNHELVEDVFFLLPESNLRVFLFDLFEGDHCSTAGIFGICWCSEIPFQGSIAVIIDFSTGWCLGDFYIGRRNTVHPQFVVRDFFICSYSIFWIPFLPTSLMKCHRRVLITAQVGIGIPDPDDYDTPGNDWHPNRPVGVRSKSYPQKVAIIWGLFDIWSWCPD